MWTSGFSSWSPLVELLEQGFNFITDVQFSYASFSLLNAVVFVVEGEGGVEVGVVPAGYSYAFLYLSFFVFSPWLLSFAIFCGSLRSGMRGQVMHVYSRVDG